MNAEEARQFKARWQIVNDFTAEEARHAAPALKLRQLALMYEAGQSLGWADASAQGEAEVLDRWRRLRELLHV